MGAAGRDFHNFNVVYRENSGHRVVAFTATQIPDIEGRIYPSQLAGPDYPSGIPIEAEARLEELIRREVVDQVVFAYSDVAHEYVLHKASRVLAAGADFVLLGPRSTMLNASKPVIAVCAARTGAGKSQTTRHVAEILKTLGKRVVVVRHPMPYGDLAEQSVQRFATYGDLDKHGCTIEEREEYEPHIDRGSVVYAGVDYGAILAQAEKEADVILWDGGNNDLPFYRPDLHLVVVDPHRPGHELRYHPGEANVRMADVVIINKVDSAPAEGLEQVRRNVAGANPRARVIEAASPITLSGTETVQGKRVLVVEDGPTLTHGEMPYGAGVILARRQGASELVDPRPYAAGSIGEVYNRYPHIGPLLPAMGYGRRQVEELEQTINAVPADLVLIATPIDLRRLVAINKPAARVGYELEEVGEPALGPILRGLLERA
ncbi:MAG: cyclic 2,3-diphosphoglycerate synthase [bacterium]|nr:cyclic 2,3-diphosphoglycerate synthase [bacterium]